MKLEKVLNYEYDKVGLEKQIQELESQFRKSELNKNLIRKCKSEILEVNILKHLNSNKKIKAIKYVRDYTDKYKNNKSSMSIDEAIENKTNMRGTDLYVQMLGGEVFDVDMKVLEYDPIHRKTKKVMNGNLVNNNWGMERFIFQVEGVWNEKGWANKTEKTTDVLMIYIEETNKIYSFNYKGLCKWINEKLDNKEITEKDYIPFGKYWNKCDREYQTWEYVISIPCDEIPIGVITNIYDV